MNAAAATKKEIQPFDEITLTVAQDCLDRLTETVALANEDTVHALRVATKRLRAAWHLGKAVAGTEFARQRRDALRGLSAHLSGARDQTVLERLARDLAARQTDGQIAHALDQVGEWLHEHAAPDPREAIDSENNLAFLQKGLREEIQAWHAFDQCDPQFMRRAIRHQLRKSHSRARRASRRARHDVDADLWHEWRKAVKRLRYQREFVAASQGREPGKFDDGISRLGSRLGERNDYANLAALADQLASSRILDRKHHGLVRKAIAVEEEDILRNCRRLGRRTLLPRGS